MTGAGNVDGRMMSKAGSDRHVVNSNPPSSHTYIASDSKVVEQNSTRDVIAMRDGSWWELTARTRPPLFISVWIRDVVIGNDSHRRKTRSGFCISFLKYSMDGKKVGWKNRPSPKVRVCFQLKFLSVHFSCRRLCAWDGNKSLEDLLPAIDRKTTTAREIDLYEEGRSIVVGTTHNR